MKKLIALLVLFAAVCGCGNDSEYKKVSVKTGKANEQGFTLLQGKKDVKQQVLRVAVAPVISPKSSIEFYTDLIRYISAKSGIELEVIQKGTYSETVDLLKSGLCDVAFMCSGAYVSAKMEFPLEVLVEPVVYGKPKYHSYLIVHLDSSVENMGQLRGMNFAFTDPLSLSGYLYPVSVLKKNGDNPGDYFKKVVFTKSHDFSIQAVAEKVADAASVDSLVYEYLKAENDPHAHMTRVISVSEPLSIPPVVARESLDEGIKQKIRDVMLSVHTDAQGLAIIKNIHIDRFVLPHENDYKDVELIMKKAGRL